MEPGRGLNLAPELIKQLVPGTLDRTTINEQLAALKRAIFERALGAELTHDLGYEKGEPMGLSEFPCSRRVENYTDGRTNRSA